MLSVIASRQYLSQEDNLVQSSKYSAEMGAGGT